MENVRSETPVMIPGRMSGSSTRRWNSVLPGKSCRSSRNAPGTPTASEMSTASTASLRLATTAATIPRSCHRTLYQDNVPSLSGQAMMRESWNEYRTTTRSGV